MIPVLATSERGKLLNGDLLEMANVSHVLRPDESQAGCRPSGFRGLMDDPELSRLFDIVMSLSDYANDKKVYEAADLLELALDAILLHKQRLDKGVYYFRSRRTLPRKWKTQKRELERIRKKIVAKIVDNAMNDELDSRQVIRTPDAF